MTVFYTLSHISPDQVFLGTILGATLGYSFSCLMQFCHKKKYIDRESYVAQYLALAIFTIGIARTLGLDDLLAAFAAGNAISWDGDFNTQTEDEVFASVIDLLLNCACFVYIGAWMPFNEFHNEALGITPWRLLALLLLTLGLRRIPVLLLLYPWIPEVRSWQEALFTGHFGDQSLMYTMDQDLSCSVGPMGVGAVFVSTLAVHRLHDGDPDNVQREILALTIQPIVLFIVLGSIFIRKLASNSFPADRSFIDGLSIPFFSAGRTMSRNMSRTMSRTMSGSLAASVTHRITPFWGHSAHPTVAQQGEGRLEEGNCQRTAVEMGDCSASTPTVIRSRRPSLKISGSRP